MKKLLLSSIVMFGICSFATAQKATADQKAKADPQTVNAASAVSPQIATDVQMKAKMKAENASQTTFATADGNVAVKAADATAAKPMTETEAIQKKKEIQQAAEKKAAYDKKAAAARPVDATVAPTKNDN